MKFSVFASMSASFDEAAKSGTGGEMDEIKRMLTETNVYLLITTVVVTILHMVFECKSTCGEQDFAECDAVLAFSSDVSHWRQKKEMVGGQSRSSFLLPGFDEMLN